MPGPTRTLDRDARDVLAIPTNPTATGPTELRTVWLKLGSSGYRVRELQRAGDAWKELFAIEMKRLK